MLSAAADQLLLKVVGDVQVSFSGYLAATKDTVTACMLFVWEKSGCRFGSNGLL